MAPNNGRRQRERERERERAPQLTPFDSSMTPTARYNHNLKVIRRHDPSIEAVFHQFAFVCLYHYNGVQRGWEKRGCEGSMFLFERGEHPKYGFFILNRTGTGDYIQRMDASDNMEMSDKYLIYRAHGEESHQVIGLWSHSEDDRAMLGRVMTKLHECIKKDVPYPQAWRMNPSAWPAPLPLPESEDEADPDPEPEQPNLIDALFAKLVPAQPQPQPSAPARAPKPQPAGVQRPPAPAPAAPRAQPIPPPQPQPPAHDPRLALLDRLFASAPVPTPPPAPPAEPARAEVQAPQPQVLTGDVLQMLLGNGAIEAWRRGTADGHRGDEPLVEDRAALVDAVGHVFVAREGPPQGAPLDRNAFGRRLVELIHTDKLFMDQLHREYLRRV